MRRLLAFSICALATPLTSSAQPDPLCALNCRAAVPGRAALAYEACLALVCHPGVPNGPAWEAGRIDDPGHGGFASVQSDDFSQQLILTCESRGPISVALRTATLDRGEVQWLVDGQSVEWLDLRQRGGLLVAEVPRASRLIMALQDGGRVTVLSQDGRLQTSFGLRGSNRAITQAMGYCAER
jgi:hypothetical protein